MQKLKLLIDIILQNIYNMKKNTLQITRCIVSALLVINFFFVLSVPNSFALKVEDISATDYVTDYTNTLNGEQILEISKNLNKIETQKGYQIAVVIVDNLDGDYIEHYVTTLYEKLGLGTKEKDEGMLWLIVKDERLMRMEVGYGLESVLTDGVTKKIQDNFVQPEFKNDNYYAGVKIGAEKISEVLLTGIAGDNSVASTNQDFNLPFEFIVFLFFVILNIFGWLFAIIARTKSWWLGGVVTFVLGAITLSFFGFYLLTNILLFIFTLSGFIFDYFISKNYKYWQQQNSFNGGTKGKPAWWAGGTWGPGSGGFKSGGSGFGGFGGGGMSGGGGSNSSW